MFNNFNHNFSLQNCKPNGTTTTTSYLAAELYQNHSSGVHATSKVNPPDQQSPNVMLPNIHNTNSALPTFTEHSTANQTTVANLSKATTQRQQSTNSYISPQTRSFGFAAKNRVTPESRHFSPSSFVTPHNRHYAESSFAKHASRVPLGNESADLEYMVSFLEQTVMQSLTK